MAETTRWKDIYTHLKNAGFDVYSPAQHKGECTSPYVVVRNAGTSPYQQFTSTVTVYEVLCYVPENKYSTLGDYTEKVKASMRGLWPMITPLNYETPPFFEDAVKAHMTAIQYQNVRYAPKGGK